MPKESRQVTKHPTLVAEKRARFDMTQGSIRLPALLVTD
jgi:hypothetical protein